MQLFRIGLLLAWLCPFWGALAAPPGVLREAIRKAISQGRFAAAGKLLDEFEEIEPAGEAKFVDQLFSPYFDPRRSTAAVSQGLFWFVASDEPTKGWELLDALFKNPKRRAQVMQALNDIPGQGPRLDSLLIRTLNGGLRESLIPVRNDLLRMASERNELELINTFKLAMLSQEAGVRFLAQSYFEQPDILNHKNLSLEFLPALDSSRPVAVRREAARFINNHFLQSDQPFDWLRTLIKAKDDGDPQVTSDIFNALERFPRNQAPAPEDLGAFRIDLSDFLNLLSRRGPEEFSTSGAAILQRWGNDLDFNSLIRLSQSPAGPIQKAAWSQVKKIPRVQNWLASAQAPTQMEDQIQFVRAEMSKLRQAQQKEKKRNRGSCEADTSLFDQTNTVEPPEDF